MANVVEGYLVQSKYEKDGKKHEPRNEGVAFNEYDARDIIEREAVYYNDSWQNYGRTLMENGVAYLSKDKNEMIMYTIEKCLVITGV
mgnify:CR=1 FL=1